MRNLPRFLAHGASICVLSFGFSVALVASEKTVQQDNKKQTTGSKPVVKDAPSDIMLLSSWNYAPLYQDGWSIRDLIQNASVYGPDGDELGSVENFVIRKNGAVAGVIAEIGGIWDIGDTHVFVPINEVNIASTGKILTVPVTEGSVEKYSTYAQDYLTRFGTKSDRYVKDNVKTGPRLWKASELIGDNAFTTEGIGIATIRDILFRDGKVTAVVLSQYASFGGGYKAVPFYGYDYGWNPGSPRYSVMYSGNALKNLPLFEYSKMSKGSSGLNPSDNSTNSKE